MVNLINLINLQVSLVCFVNVLRGFVATITKAHNPDGNIANEVSPSRLFSGIFYDCKTTPKTQS